jgi:hypothetical protein
MTKEGLPTVANAEHLTDALRRSGVLGDGRVCNVVMESSRATLLSQIIRLRLTYDGAGSEAPSSVILKTAHPERIGDPFNAGRQEVAFYARVASVMSAHLVPRCFEAFYDTDTRTWHLLLDDLTDTHVIATTWPLPPAMEQCESIVQARARFHAEWWDDPRLGASVGAWLGADAMDRQLKQFAEQFARFTDRLGDSLPRERRNLYERLLDVAPLLIARYHSHRNMTIVQGDAHVWNCFLPRDGRGDDVYFFDWDSWRLDVGSDDLAYMMAMHWYPDRRRRMERPLLDSYHTTLVAHGVSDYARHALDDDYRLSVLWQITTPVWQAANNIPPVIWWNNLERILLAVDDLGCLDLLI